MNSVGRIASKNWLSLLLIFLFTFSVSLVGARFVRSIFLGSTLAETEPAAVEASDQISTPTVLPTSLDFQSTLDTWIANNNEYGIVIYDLDRNEISAAHRADDVFTTIPAHNLLLAYNGYREIDLGLTAPDFTLTDPVSGTDIDYDACLAQIMQTPANNCASAIVSNSLLSDSATRLIETFDLINSTELATYSTPTDTTKLLQKVWQHEDLTLESWAKLQDSMSLPIAPSEDSLSGLAYGFSTAHIYDQTYAVPVETAWQNYAEILFADFVRLNRHFAIVIASDTVSDANVLSRLGTLIEGKVLELAN